MADSGAEKSRTTLGSALGVTVSAFAVFVPLLYVIGRVYSDAYWRALGIDGDIMNVAVEEYIYLGFVVIANILFHFLGILAPNITGLWLVALAFLAIAVLSGVMLLAWFGKGLRALVLRGEKTIGKWARADRASARFARVYFVSGQVVNSAFFAVLAPVFLLALAIHGVSQFGRVKAEKAINGIQSGLAGNGRPASVATSEDGHRLIVSCASEWCVLADAEGLIALRRDQISSIRACASLVIAENEKLECVPLKPYQGQRIGSQNPDTEIQEESLKALEASTPSVHD